MLFPFRYEKAKDLNQAISMSYGENIKFIAGGTDLLVIMRARQTSPDLLIDITDVPELKEIKYEQGKLFIGASVALNIVAENQYVKEYFPTLREAILCIGSPLIRNMGTLGGNVQTASPAADGLVALIAENAQVEVYGREGKRLLPISSFIIGPKKTSLLQGELITGFWLMPELWSYTKFFKKGRRNALAISIANGVVKLAIDSEKIQDARIVLGAVGPTPLRIKQVEDFIIGNSINTILQKDFQDMIKQKVASEIKPISDIRASAEYRAYIAAVMCVRLLQQSTEVSN